MVALLVPDAEWMAEWAADNGKADDLVQLAGDGDFRKALEAAVERVNEGLSNVERVRRFSVATEPFTIDNEQMTPTLKVRRHKVIEIYGDTIEGLYTGPIRL